MFYLFYYKLNSLFFPIKYNVSVGRGGSHKVCYGVLFRWEGVQNYEKLCYIINLWHFMAFCYYYILFKCFSTEMVLIEKKG